MKSTTRQELLEMYEEARTDLRIAVDGGNKREIRLAREQVDALELILSNNKGENK